MSLDADEKTCPYCGKNIKAEAIRCRSIGQNPENRSLKQLTLRWFSIRVRCAGDR